VILSQDGKAEWNKRIRAGLFVYLVTTIIYGFKCRLYGKIQTRIEDVKKELSDLKSFLEALGINGIYVKTLNNLIKEVEIKEKLYTSRWLVNEELLTEIVNELNNLETIIVDRLGRKPIVIFHPVGRLNYDKLVKEGLRALLQDSVLLNRLSKVVKHDLEEALYCLCFERPTAATMVALRAVEAALRELYLAFKPNAKIKGINWKKIINELRELFRQRNIEAETLIGYLDHLRSIRNAAEHPDKIFSQIEGEDTLIKTCDAIREIYKIINELKIG